MSEGSSFDFERVDDEEKQLYIKIKKEEQFQQKREALEVRYQSNNSASTGVIRTVGSNRGAGEQLNKFMR